VRILVVEDESKFSRILQTGLTAEQFAVDLARDGEEALFLAKDTAYDVIILDIMLPRLDGISVLKKLRKQRLKTPVLILSGRSGVEDRVMGLECGADDYLAKPFSFDELLARVRALLRRPPKLEDKLSVADLELDRTWRRVTRGGKPIQLTPKEYSLLEYLMRNAGRPVTRTMIVEHVWDIGFEGLTNIVDVYINYLRAKIDRLHDKKLIHTARGVGYVLMDPKGEEAA
jgi:two-component system copper resistance phosphate regulon response regulator CusR